MGDTSPLPDASPSAALPPPRPRWRRWAKAFSLALAALVFAPLLVVLLTTHIGDAVDALTKPPPGVGIVVPEAALPDDDAFATLLKLAEPVDTVFETIRKDRKSQDKHCGGLATQKPLDWSCVDALVRETADPLKALDAWLAGPSRYRLDRPPNLDRHLRITGLDFKNYVTAKWPNVLAFSSLSRALAYRSLLRQKAGDVAGAERDLRTLFALGSFLQQNPILIAHMVGISVHQVGLGALVTHLPVESAAPDVDHLLSVPQLYVEGMKAAIGAEWLGFREYIRNDFSGVGEPSSSSLRDFAWGLPLPVLVTFGLYSQAHTLRLLAGDSQAALRQLETGLMAGTASADYWRPVCPNVDEWIWPVFFIRPNPVGRIFACISGVTWDRYLVRTGQAMDRLVATHVVLAARRFKQQQGRWPTDEQDLVPAYLKAWPASALDGQSLRWLEDKSGVLILGDDGKKPCESSQWCRLPFDPPVPVGPGAKETKARQLRKA